MRRRVNSGCIALNFGVSLLATRNGGHQMCGEVGVVKKLDLESISKDISELVKQLGKEVEGDVKGSDLKKIDDKVHKLIAS
jgi:hypothetical protein